MSNNNQTNAFIKWMVILGDFILLNVILFGFMHLHPMMLRWGWERNRVFIMACNFAFLLSQWHFHTIIQERLVSAGNVLRRIMLLVMSQTLLAYIVLKLIDKSLATAVLLIPIGLSLLAVVVLVRFLERQAIKRYRMRGGNTRTITFVGISNEQMEAYNQLMNDPTTGYRVKGYYSDEEMPNEPEGLLWLGTIDGLLNRLDEGPEPLQIGDELYVCLSRREKDTIQRLSHFCDLHIVRFFYVPVAVEKIELDLKREYIADVEVYTTHESPLQDPVNKVIKRCLDIVLSLVALILTCLLFPVIYLIIKIQSPGPIFFKQLRTGLDGKDFCCYKFRSMHVNDDADRVQATKDDPRKYPFGNFMRKANIDELPQFWNVLRGEMSVVGPRPHMLAHTEQYSKLIDKYMVRHFVKPGITGWAQVSGFRGETQELWQMEGRVKRDIWYMENWSVWLDIRIVWITIKSIFVHDKKAY